LACNIYRKPTSTNTVIRETSFHPIEHETAAFSCLYKRKNTYPLSKNDKNEELKIMQKIAPESNYLPTKIRKKEIKN
jgi:hypothetical protein